MATGLLGQIDIQLAQAKLAIAQQEMQLKAQEAQMQMMFKQRTGEMDLVQKQQVNDMQLQAAAAKAAQASQPPLPGAQ